MGFKRKWKQFWRRNLTERQEAERSIAADSIVAQNEANNLLSQIREDADRARCSLSEYSKEQTLKINKDYDDCVSSTQSELDSIVDKFNKEMSGLDLEYQSIFKSIQDKFFDNKNNLYKSLEKELNLLRQGLEYTKQQFDDKKLKYNIHLQDIDSHKSTKKYQRLHSKCKGAYINLKQHCGPYSARANSYSLLVGYLRSLHANKIINLAEQERYKSFFYALYCSDVDLNSANFKRIDSEIVDVFSTAEKYDEELINSAYRLDTATIRRYKKSDADYSTSLKKEATRLENELRASY